MSRDLTDRATRRVLTILCILIVLCITLLGYVVGTTLANGRHHADKIAIQQVAIANQKEIDGGCDRANITKAVYNRASYAFYTFLTKQGRAVASSSPNPQIRKLAQLDTRLASHQVWQPLVNCKIAVQAGVRYQNPKPIYFTTQLPTRNALALPPPPHTGS